LLPIHAAHRVGAALEAVDGRRGDAAETGSCLPAGSAAKCWEVSEQGAGGGGRWKGEDLGFGRKGRERA